VQFRTLCHQTFTTVGNFDRHRSAKGEHGSCRPPAEVGLHLIERPGYQAWSEPSDYWAETTS
jgi:hypothetical protein